MKKECINTPGNAVITEKMTSILDVIALSRDLVNDS